MSDQSTSDFLDVLAVLDAFDPLISRQALASYVLPQVGLLPHCENTAAYAAAIAEEMGLPEEDVTRIWAAGFFHDLGKIGIDEAILTKPAPLTAEERDSLNAHPVITGNLLRLSSTTRLFAECAMFHHERIDGTGYPYGLRGEEIPLGARIVAVADAYDAMISDRVYRLAIGKRRASAELREGRGTQFDTDVVDAALRLIRQGKI